jgi:hypothetical protein
MAWAVPPGSKYSWSMRSNTLEQAMNTTETTAATSPATTEPAPTPKKVKKGAKKGPAPKAAAGSRSSEVAAAAPSKAGSNPNCLMATGHVATARQVGVKEVYVYLTPKGKKADPADLTKDD